MAFEGIATKIVCPRSRTSFVKLEVQHALVSIFSETLDVRWRLIRDSLWIQDRAHMSYDLAWIDPVTLLHENFPKLCVLTDQAIAVFDQNIVGDVPIG